GELPAPRTWDRAAALEKTLVKMPYDRFRSDDQALFETLDALVQDGIVFLTGVPTAERQGHHTELRKAVERVGSLRRTWYGDLWDVKAVEGSLNIAYTNLDLGLHMDLTHFDNPPRYQFLHSLQNARVKGGLSYFVDTYAVAAHLHATAPSVFSTLAHENVHFEYRNGGQHTRFVRPTLELTPGSNSRLHAVNYSPPFQGPLPLERLSTTSSSSLEGVVSDDAQRLADLHDALSEFSHLCDDPASPFRFEHQLEPGQCVIFDNRRVLHARTAFEFEPPAQGEEEEGEVGRWLKGAYMDGDELWSKWRVLSQKLREQDEERLRTKGRTLFV
ncbi:gamma-butyrobetaine dioxygenase, partial [Rhodotorula sp. JG-1b]